jgi:cytochrome c oxidase assembly protein subunit 15
MSWGEGFTFARELGRRADGTPIAMTALVAIQWAHRLFAVVFVAAMGWLVARLWTRGPPSRRRAVIMAALVVLQLATGLSNVVLGWPLLAALAHTAGAAALVVCIGFEVAAALNKRIRVSSP